MDDSQSIIWQVRCCEQEGSCVFALPGSPLILAANLRCMSFLSYGRKYRLMDKKYLFYPLQMFVVRNV